MTVTPTGIHPDLADLAGPMVPLSWLMAALAEAEKQAADYQSRTVDLRPSSSSPRRVDVIADGYREAAELIRDFVAYRIDPQAHAAEEARRCAEYARGMGFTQEGDR